MGTPREVPRQGLRSPLGPLPISTQNCFSCICFKLKVKVLVAQSCLILSKPMDCVAHQALLSMEFSRQEYWSGLPFPSPGDRPHPGIKPGSPSLQAVQSEQYCLNSKESFGKRSLPLNMLEHYHFWFWGLRDDVTCSWPQRAVGGQTHRQIHCSTVAVLVAIQVGVSRDNWKQEVVRGLP